TSFYFKTTKVAEWTLSAYLVASGNDEDSFLSALRYLFKFKAVPLDIRLFAKDLHNFYSGSFRVEVKAIARNNARSEINRSMFSSKERLIVQGRYNDDLERDMSELNNPFIVQPNSASVEDQECHKDFMKAPSAPSPSTPLSTASTESSCSTTDKKQRTTYTSEEPWRSLTITLAKIVNGEKNATFPESLPTMTPVHAQLFDHAVKSLEEYQAQSCQEKDIVLVKDAQVCEHFSQADDADLIDDAKALSTIADFESHPSTVYLRITTDRGALSRKYMDEEHLPKEADIEDKVLRILEYLGEKALKASKIMRQMQSAEYSDVSDAGRKVDCLFMMDDIELSNVEFKSPEICKKELAIQNRKNVRLTRCIQEAHVTLGIEDANVLMADVFGFVGVFYQVKPMGAIAIAGKTTSTLVQLPRTVGELEEFLEGNSLGIIWNFVSYLEQQGPRIIRAKERFNSAQVRARLSDAIASSPGGTPPPVNRTYQHNLRRGVPAAQW
ncbi:hypothetical protein BGZ99_001664, partial [Dissophora globulifera]